MNSRWAWVFVVIPLFVSCGDHKVAGGSTVETDNAVSLQVVGMEGVPNSNIVARIRPTWFVSDTGKQNVLAEYSQDIFADSKGWIHCKSLPSGSYTMEIRSQGYGALKHFDRQDTAAFDDLGSLTLKLLGSVEGSVELPEQAKYAWVQIYGLDRLIKTDSLGKFRIDSIPDGTHHIRAITSVSSSIAAEDHIQVRSGYSSNIGAISPASIYSEDPLTWKYSQFISVDSLFSEWMLPIPEPSVGILRLDSTNFDFTQAMNDGRDLRFFDGQGNRLVFERASWNSVRRTAVIRIRISKMPLNSQIEMRWGCDGSVDPGSEGLWEGVLDSIFEELYALHIADFEDGTLFTSMSPPNDNHMWYLLPQDTTMHISPHSDTAHLGIQPAGYGRDGKAFHVTSTGPVNRWVLFGMVLDTIPANFEQMDSVVFWVRGTGQYSFAFECLSGVEGKALFTDSLDTAWKRKAIRPDDFLAGDGKYGNLGWEGVAHSVTNISFFAYGNADFWLDDVRIYGLNGDDLR